MNDYSEILETRGDYRVSIVPHPYAEPPDWDGQGTIVQLEGHWEPVSHIMHPNTGDDFSIGYLWGHWHDMELIERYLRIFRGVVGFDYFDTRDGKYVCIVTVADLKDWGFKNLADWKRAATKHDMDPNPAKGNLAAWQAWAEGEVYGYRIERRAHHWVTTIDWTGDTVENTADPDDWDEVESAWGYYGETDVREQALEAFNDYLTREDVPA